MQEQANQVQGEAGELPKELIAEMKRSEALVFIGADAQGVLQVRGTVNGGAYEPGTNKCHAYVAAIYSEHSHLLDVINGRLTDAVRFRALRDFGLLAKSDPARFTVINEGMAAFELANNMADESTNRTAEDYTKIANFIAQAIVETAPTVHDEAAIEAAEEKRERRAEKVLIRNAAGTLLN